MWLFQDLCQVLLGIVEGLFESMEVWVISWEFGYLGKCGRLESWRAADILGRVCGDRQ